MKILVTGGAGFVGSHLCERLVENKENEIYSLDNYFTGSKDNHIKGVNYFEGDVKNISEIIDFCPDIVYHLGEYSRVEQSFGDIKKVWDFNKKGIFSILEFCIKNDSKIIYAGSSTKFGDGNLGRSQSPYAWTKATNTELVVNYGKWFDLKYAITYFYNAYGGREIQNGKYATLIGIFKNQMKQGKNLSVVSPGNQQRNFTHIDDIISGLEKVGEKGVGDEFGIGNDKSHSIIEVANLFGGKISMLPERPGNRMSANVVTKKTKDLGWLPKISLEDYIEDLKKNNWV